MVAVSKPGEKTYLAQVIFVEGGARFSDANYCQVVGSPTAT